MKASLRILTLLIVAALALWWWKRDTPPALLTETPETQREHATPDATPASVRALSPESPDATTDSWRGPQKREGVDAANLYAEAFALFDRLTDEEKNILRKPSEEVDAETAAQLFEKLQPILELLRAAAKAGYCDWGTGEITFETTLPHMGKAQQLGSVAIWASAYRFPSDPATAIDDLGALSRLGHHLSDTMIGVLVSGSIEARANKLLAQHLGALDGAMLDKARALIADSPIDADLTRAFRGESSGVKNFLERLEAGDTRERGRLLRQVQGDGGKPDEWLDPAKDFAAGAVVSLALLGKDFSLMRRVHEQAPEKLRLPDAEFQGWWKGIERELESGHPIARIALPSLTQFQRNVQTLRVNRALLTAAADIVQHGPGQIGKYRDPATGNAITYTPTATGFELRSPYVVKGKPVTMSFERRATAP